MSHTGSFAPEPSGSSASRCPLCPQLRPENCTPRFDAMGHERTHAFIRKLHTGRLARSYWQQELSSLMPTCLALHAASG